MTVTYPKMRSILQRMILLGAWASSSVYGQSSFAKEEFSEDDFAQFFSLIENGKISREKMSERCAAQAIGFTFLGEGVVHEGGPRRIFYNVSREDSSVDGRTLRAKHFNASFGEWTGSVFKPLCPGLYSITVDFVAGDNAESASESVEVNIHLRRPGEERPGRIIGTASKTGPNVSGTGHATVALPLRSADEISTWSVAPDGKSSRSFLRVTLTAYKVTHLEDYVTEVDMDEWTEEITLLKKTAAD